MDEKPVNEPVLMIGAALLCIAPMGMAWGQVAPASNAVQTINVTGYADPVQKTELSNDPAANPASVTALKLTEEKTRSIRDYVDLFKPVLGVAANNFDPMTSASASRCAAFRSAATAAAWRIRSPSCA